MYLIPLQAIPNQRLTVRLEGFLFDLTVKAAKTLMTASIARDGQTIVQGVRCLPNTPLIPYRYLEGGAGNFAFQTDDDSYPDYTRFGGTDRLYYFTRAEMEAIRNG